MTERSDEQLIGDYLKGDQQALEFLIKRYLKPIYGFICRYLGGLPEAEDVTQDVFVRAWRHLKKFNRRKSFRTWLFAIAKNAAFDWLKKKKHFNFSDFTDEAGNNMLEETLIDPEPLPSELMERADVGQILEKALKQLPLSYQTVLILHYNEHFTLSEIAEILGEPKNTVKSRHRRGLIILRKILTAES